MGLTIHYSLASAAASPEDARALLEKLRNRARDLPFAEVGQIIEVQGKPAYDPDHLDHDDPYRWLKTQGCNVFKYMVKGDEFWGRIAPEHLIAFSIYPGDGCEQANIGLCRYPKTIINNGKRVRTRLDGWRWSSFCKTQYASNPDCGGLDNFIRCHLGVVKLLDYAADLKILAEVKDESGYFEKRNAVELVKEIGEWNEMIAGLFGKMKDTLELLGHDAKTLISEIAKYPNFEHLEADGRKEERD
jgi:hypothetical protein